MTMKLKQFQADLTAGKYDEKLCISNNYINKKHYSLLLIIC